jgi:hypothetical protein
MYRVDLQGQLYPREYDMFLLFWNAACVSSKFEGGVTCNGPATVYNTGR